MEQKIPAPLRVRGVTKHFHQGPALVTALSKVDLEVREGEFIAIMGASGSGKSTLLHAAAGLTHVDEGAVEIRGRDLASLSDAALTRYRRKHVGLIFQAFNLIPALTAEDNIRLPLLGAARSYDKVEALLERLDLRARRGHRPDALSGGEQQRVAIARALVTDPDLVLADEPTGSLDSVTGQYLCALLRELRDEEARTIVVVTHEPTVAMWADRVVVLRDGAQLAEFTPDGRHEPQTVTRAYQGALEASS